MTIQIYHNPRCSKSRQTLQILEDKNLQFSQVLYLDNIPSKEQLQNILKMLKLTDPRDLMRQHEAEYQALNLANPNKTVDQLLAAMIAHPILIERPIVINNNQARIGRPPESILDII